MFEILEQSSGKVVALNVCGKLHHSDYEELEPKLETIINENGSIQLICYMEDFEGWDLQALWDDLMLDIKHCKDIDRLAIVGNKKWMAYSAKLAKMFINGEAKFFSPNLKDEAWEWIQDGAGSEQMH